MSGSNSTNIVQVIVSENVAAAPSKLQNTGAFVSIGGTTKTAGTLSLLTQANDFTAIVNTGVGNATELLNWVTEFYAQGQTKPVYVLELGVGANALSLQTWITANPLMVYAYATPSAWDTEVSIPTPSAPTLSQVSGGTLSGATYYVKVTLTNETGETLPSSEVSLAVTANHLLDVSSPAAVTGVTGYNVYVGTTAGSETKQTTSPIAIGTAWTMPTTGLATGGPLPTVNTTSTEFAGVLSEYTGTEALTYFFLTTTINTYAQYAGLKCVYANIESPAAPSTQVSVIAAFYKFISYSPGAASKMTQMAFSYVYASTAYPVLGNAALFATLKAANVNFIGTGAEGGVTNTLIVGGKLQDGNDASVWWEIDWINIQCHQAIANAVINGSNNPQSPLDYDQPGIDDLLAVVQQVVTNGINWGVVNPQLPLTLSATPFITYVTANPGDYSAGIYNGLALSCYPMRGFQSITFNLTVYL